MVDVEVDENLVSMLRVLQSETRKLQEEDQRRDVEVATLKAELASRQARLREMEEKIVIRRYLLDSVLLHQKRELIQAETGRREWFREDLQDPEYQVVVSKQGEVFEV